MSRLIYRCFQPHQENDTGIQSTEMAEMFSDQRETIQLLVCNSDGALCLLLLAAPLKPCGDSSGCSQPSPLGLLSHPALSLVPVVAQDLPAWIQLWIRNWACVKPGFCSLLVHYANQTVPEITFWYLFLCIYSTVWLSPPVAPGPSFSAGPQETTFSKYHTASSSKQHIWLSLLASVLFFNLVWLSATFRLSALAWEPWVQQTTLFSTLPLVPTFFTQIRVILLDWLGWPAELNSMVFYQQRGRLHTTREKEEF